MERWKDGKMEIREMMEIREIWNDGKMEIWLITNF
jgi:hypothetical protein